MSTHNIGFEIQFLKVCIMELRDSLLSKALEHYIGPITSKDHLLVFVYYARAKKCFAQRYALVGPIASCSGSKLWPLSFTLPCQRSMTQSEIYRT